MAQPHLELSAFALVWVRWDCIWCKHFGEGRKKKLFEKGEELGLNIDPNGDLILSLNSPYHQRGRDSSFLKVSRSR